MTNREALQCLYIGAGKAYTGRDIYEAKAVLEKDLDDLEKYEMALEIISNYVHPSIVIQNGSYYWVAGCGRDLFWYVLSPKDGELLFEIFGGTNHDSR